MTLEEKIACLGTQPNVPRLGIQGTDHAEGLHGLAMGGVGDWGAGNPIPTTMFPQSIGLAETWDPEIVRRAAAIVGYEARYIAQSPQYKRSHLVVRAPNADLGRDVRWGRTEECFGEDPFFNGTMTVAFVKGLQGDHPTYWQAASLLKHFLANSHENGRERTSSNFDERLLMEYYSVPFRMGIVEGGARGHMLAYNAVNGVPCHVHPIVRQLTIDAWGQDGIICTDAAGMTLLVTGHGYCSNYPEAAAAVIETGAGQFLDDYRGPVHEALERGILSERAIDQVLKGTFRVMMRLGLLDDPAQVPYSSIGVDGAGAPWLTEQHQAVARLATLKSIVLLKNADHLLPLDLQTLRSIAVIGPRASDVLLDWYSGTPPYAISPLAGIRAKVGGGVVVRYAGGEDIEAARQAAASSDIAIICAGNHPTGNRGWAEVEFSSEGREAVDRESITLEQEELIKQVYSANPNTVAVLISSFPYAIDWTQQHVPAILHMTHNSQELGNALADVLFGDYTPGGRLVQTWPSSHDQLPAMLDYDIRHGRTYQYCDGAPLYPFGFGLSYTTFEYARLQTSAGQLDSHGSLTVSVDVTNSGGRAGEEVVQLYVRHLASRVERPKHELKGFQRLHLEPGETQTVRMTLSAEQLAYWDVARQAFVVEQGAVQIEIGASSADIKLRAILLVVE